MNYLADTVAIVHHLRRPSRVGSECRRILREADEGQHHVFISAISLMEVLYLAEAKRIALSLGDLLAMVSSSQNYSIVPVDSQVVEAAQTIDDVPELHDRILAATAAVYAVSMLTPDAVMAASQHVDAIWD
ncbi:MAG: PIN domain-containing protein [Candidatus Promineofilum sp.]|nr:PIN domain-containing protein [Promineifilum sp.]